MYPVTFFFRHPDPIYFSIEGLFNMIADSIAETYSAEFKMAKITMPYKSSLRNIFKNISFVSGNQSLVNHITGDIHYTILGCNKCNINILTIHDCVVLHKYKRTDPRYWVIKWLWYDLPVRKADIITVISENTREEIIRFTGCRPGKIRLIPNLVDPAFIPRPARFRTEQPRILFIGTTPNKNLDRLIEALAGLPVSLEIVGQLTVIQIDQLEKHAISYKQSSGLTKAGLLEKYCDCDILAFPSTYEGFGLPLLEAQATGRPVLTSDLSPMKNVAGQGACLADPYDSSSIRQGLLRIIENDSYREELIRKGYENVKRYGLKTVMAEYAALYREMIAKKKTN